MARIALAFLFGALIFPLLDGIHTHWNVLQYTQPWIWKMAWWVPPEFGLTWVVIALAIPAIERRIASWVGEWDSPTIDQILGELILFSAIYGFTGVFHHLGAGALSVLLYGLAGARLALASHKGDVIFVIAAAILGPVGEAIVSATGGFHYTQPDFLGVPMWLPALWAHGGFFARRLMRMPLLQP
jgi:hypothetical protein